MIQLELVASIEGRRSEAWEVASAVAAIARTDLREPDLYPSQRVENAWDLVLSIPIAPAEDPEVLRQALAAQLGTGFRMDHECLFAHRDEPDGHFISPQIRGILIRVIDP